MKNFSMRYFSVIIILPILLFSLGLTGCGTDFEGLVLGILEEWADEHDINPSTPGGAWNLATRTASGSTGDEEADAALSITQTISDIYEGDKLLEEGEKLRSEGKTEEAAEKIDAAIEKRPDDLTYRISRGTLAIQVGDTETAMSQHGEAVRRLGTETIIPTSTMDRHLPEVEHPRPHEEFRYYTQVIDTLESSELNPYQMNDETKRWYYTQLSAAYAGRAEARYHIDGKATSEYQLDWQKGKEVYENFRNVGR